MLENADIAMKELPKVTLVRAQKGKRGSSFHPLKEYTNNHAQNIGKNMNIKGNFHKVSDRNKHVIG